MTVETTIKPVKHCFAMGQTMTFLTLRNIPVGFGVAEGTLQCRVLFAGTSQFFGGFFVATCARSCRGFLAKINFSRLVDRVATGAAAVVNEGRMRFFMALSTVREIPVTVMVTVSTLNFSMGTWMFSDFSGL